MKVAPAKPYRPRIEGAAIGCRKACAVNSVVRLGASEGANCTGASSRTVDVDMLVIVCLLVFAGRQRSANAERPGAERGDLVQCFTRLAADSRRCNGMRQTG
jgi:hypothetical protein